MIYVAYIDEFGHIGPYISSTHPQYNTHPVFGLGGFVIPIEQIRNFSTFFYQLKCNLLSWEIEEARKHHSSFHPARWEKKGSSLFTVKNVTKYRELRVATNRILNRIREVGGFVFYVGQMKKFDENPKDRYRYLLNEAIKRLNECCESSESRFMMIIDEQESRARDQHASMRAKIVEAAAVAMFGSQKRRTLLEPPIEAESHLYQNLQCADWLCGLIGRIAYYQVVPEEKPDYECFVRYFDERIKQVAKHSSIRTFRYTRIEDLQKKYNGR
jgi:hypothetical protein